MRCYCCNETAEHTRKGVDYCNVCFESLREIDFGQTFDKDTVESLEITVDKEWDE